MSKFVTGLAFDPVVTQHDPGFGHPEQPARFTAVMDALAALPLIHLPARAATDEDLRLVHPQSYIDLVRQEVASNRRQLSTGDADISSGSLTAALAAAGCVLSAVDAVFNSAAQNAFCAVRPPGHHANAARGMGFCLFNNVALGARYAQRRFGVGRVLIADWDVHHGNGTQDIFYSDESVLFFSTHQSPWYPGTGAANERGNGKGEGFTLNCPFPAGAGRTEILGALEQVLVPAAKAFQPDLVMISAGFDSRIGDPLGQFTLEDRDFRDLTSLLMTIATENCSGRVVSVLEGGYSLTGLAHGVAAHVGALAAG